MCARLRVMARCRLVNELVSPRSAGEDREEGAEKGADAVVLTASTATSPREHHYSETTENKGRKTTTHGTQHLWRRKEIQVSSSSIAEG